MNQVVRGLHAQVDFDQDAHIVEVDATGVITEEAPYKYVSKMRCLYCSFRSNFSTRGAWQRFLCLVAVRLVVVQSTFT